ncbi:hypothetical protein BZL35_00683 [Candidatus Pandoraea novymonadis]|uniref:Uncharacterized protein n=1 Tax=Candidatus Pandoraea novymonadis TaxID=1808959 RepID=A0ABX5FGF6_9BURK|nr:hypothetical protein BZL35_00683 [Candidatus Pandoraea novymonadis]
MSGDQKVIYLANAVRKYFSECPRLLIAYARPGIIHQWVVSLSVELGKEFSSFYSDNLISSLFEMCP